ncbi:extracellular matrix regulator RemB [Jeotgalibacillus proteolyticus]|uniref:extracellular matrix regulator RemB n=1 Tax=Jeotgalibacillus proteolyticus TaxID=2082395 RepID=UPI003CF94CB1
MYVHIGGESMVRMHDIVAIMDIESVKSSLIMEEFMKENDNGIVDLCESNCKSIVVTDFRVYLSPLSSSTLKKRSEKMVKPIFK